MVATAVDRGLQSDPAMSSAARRVVGTYSAAVASRRAGHGDSSRSGQDGPWTAERPSLVVHVRTPLNRARRATVSTASARARNGPIVRSCLGLRRTENRGNGSSVRTIHHHLCGNFERRLYGGACAASSLSSRTPASSSCAHSTWSTRVVSDAISFIRVRGSAPVKYWLTRRRRSTAVPT